MIKVGFLSTAIWATCLFLGACGGSGGGSSTASSSVATSSETSQSTPMESSATSSSGGSTSGDTVTIKDFAYSPPDLTVAKGTTVTFTNQDSTNHTATSSRSGTLDTGTIGQGQSKSVKLGTPGTFSYICSFHPFMHGSITVTP